MYKRILLPLDGSGLAEQSLPHAVAHAESFGAELILLRVLEPILPTGTVAPLAAARRAENLTEALACIGADIQERGVSVSTVIVEGRPRTKILNSPKQTRWI